MKSYFTAICNLRRQTLFVISFFFFCGCLPARIVQNKVDVFTNKQLRHYAKTGHLVILPFDTPGKSRDFGLKVARIFKDEISKKEDIKKITLVEDTPWLAQIDYSALKQQKALLEAGKKNADLLLFGAVEEYLSGTAGNTAITVSATVFNVATGKSLWRGRDKVVGKPGRTFLFWGQSLTPDPPDVNELLAHAARQIVREIFYLVEPEKEPGFLSKLINKFSSKKPPPHIKSAREMEAEKHYQELEIYEAVSTTEMSLMEPETEEHAQPAEPLAVDTFDEEKIAAKDIVDRALEELDSVPQNDMTAEQEANPK